MQNIIHHLLSLKIRFEKQKTFYNCIYKQKLQFDFHLPDYGMCIESDGEQHFKPLTFFGGEAACKDLKIKDTIKTQYCKENEIKLIRISYWDFENIENILIKELKIWKWNGCENMAKSNADRLYDAKKYLKECGYEIIEKTKYKCSCCGKEKSLKQNNYYRSR